MPEIFLKTQINQRYWANNIKNERIKQIVLTQETRKTDIDDQKLMTRTQVYYTINTFHGYYSDGW